MTLDQMDALVIFAFLFIGTLIYVIPWRDVNDI